MQLKQSTALCKENKLILITVLQTQKWSLYIPLIVQCSGHRVECWANRFRAVPDEEQLSQSFFSTLSCEPGFCILVPTVLHCLF